MSQDSSVCIERDSGVDGSGWIPGRDKILLYSIACRPGLRPIHRPIQWAPGAIFSEIKRPGREAGQSPPTSAEVEKM
jgi:hypothetical protein